MRRALLFILFVLSSCRLGPEYCPPIIDAPEEFVSPSTVTSNGEIDWMWWQSFEDPQLIQYIEMAACYNQDVQKALSSVCRARSSRLIVASRLYPDIDAEVRFNRNSFNTFFGGGGDISPENISSFTTNFQQEIFFVGLDAIWEIDVFGRTRKQVEAASYRIGSAIENYRAALLTVFADTARNYLNARVLQERIAAKEEEIRVLEKMLVLRKDLEESGISSHLEIIEREAEISRLKSELPPLVVDLYTFIYRLSVLTGQFPGYLVDEMLVVRPPPILPRLVETGLPSELLQRRPDVLQAEYELAAATADVGVAVRDYFPRFFLAGALGYQRFTLPNQIFDNFVWSYTADVLTPIFKGGRIRANINSEKAKAMEAFYTYEQTILRAVEETEDHIIGYSKELERMGLLQETLDDLSLSYSLTNILYEQGIKDYTEVYFKQQQVLQAQDAFFASKLQAFNELIALYKALGGGWCANECN